MGLISDLTSQYARLDANLSVIQAEIEAAKDSRVDAADLCGRIQPRADQVGQLLERYFQRERDHVFPHAERVLGDSLEEITDMSACQDEMKRAFDRFATMLPDGDSTCDVDFDVDELHAVFQRFLDSFEAHRHAERTFQTLYGTILYPSGYATD